MNKAYRTFILWLIWGSAAITIYLGLYLDTDILQFLRQDESKITWIITLLFLVGIVGSFFLTIAITKEAIEAQIQDQLAKKSGLAGLQPSARKKKAVNRFYDSLKVTALSNEAPNVEALMETEFSSYSRMSHGVETLGNLLITLGLIGTVMGLTLTLTGLTTSLDALGHDQELLLQGLRKAMGGMGTAFYTTLLGAVLGGVLLRIFALITENGISSLSETLIRTCMVHCAPDFKQSMEKDIRFLNAELEMLGDKVIALKQAFNDSKVSMNEFRESIKELYKLSGDDDGVYTLKETLRMQKYYRALLKQELQLMNRMNRSWWGRFKEFLISRKD
ncbi:MAG: MotA/TolQ/ExbB proton channel family protein [Gammaproteobacteria bacterium]|nr:MotA/TolQ/ExbB proton channel family protein [Gammaproteobacteria bacterium]